jgi:hypothetical protein
VRLAVPRLLIGLIVLICAEVFSGASIQVGIWAPWTWLMTYWLYFAHCAPALMLPIVVNLAMWTPLGLVLTSLALTGPIFSRRPS